MVESGDRVRYMQINTIPSSMPWWIRFFLELFEWQKFCFIEFTFSWSRFVCLEWTKQHILIVYAVSLFTQNGYVNLCCVNMLTCRNMRVISNHMILLSIDWVLVSICIAGALASADIETIFRTKSVELLRRFIK